MTKDQLLHVYTQANMDAVIRKARSNKLHADIQNVWDGLHGNWEAQQSLVAVRDSLVDSGVIDQ